MNIKSALSAAAVTAFCLPAQAQQLACDKSFGFRADVNGVQGQTLCASRVDTFLDAVENFTLSNMGYSQTASATAAARLNDVNMVLSYLPGSTALNYSFTELGISGTVAGANRDASEDAFVEFVKESDILGKVLNYQAKHSPTSAITGVGGAIPSIGAADFSGSFDTLRKGGGEQSNANNLLGIGMSYSSYNIDGVGDGVETATLPLSYTMRSSSDARHQLVLSMPIAKVTTGDANSFHGGLGLAYRVPLTDNWTITPGAKYSLVASKDRATVATIMSGSLMSTYVIPTAHFDIAVGNMVGIYRTGKLSHGEYSVNPDVDLKMTRNGVMVALPTSIFGASLSSEFSVIDTRYLGDEKPFVADSQEVGFTVGTNTRASNARSFLRFGVSYFRARSSDGVTLNAGYWF